jgi:predicted homoserine dehydrogenase-like protein
MPALPELLERRLDGDGPIRVGVIGAGKFASMFLNQVPFSPHLRVVAIADLDPERARRACRTVGWSEERIAATRMTGDGMALIADPEVEVVLEVTGSPAAGCAHALAAAEHGKPIVMVNVEADVLAGPVLAAAHARAGTVYSMAYGDQPALVCELVDWARTCGFDVVAAGKGTKYQPSYHEVTPDAVWDHYGLTTEQAKAAGMNPQMFNSFLDGTKSAIEMAAIANATGLAVPENGLRFPAVGAGRLQEVLIPAADGGILEASGMVEVVASAERGSEVELPDSLRWGVYVVFRAPNAYARDCFAQYGLKTDASGTYAALYRPYHLIGLELGVSIVDAVLRGEPTGATRSWAGDVVAVAKRDLAAGTMLDGEGGYCAWGKVVPAARSRAMRALPIGLAHGVALVRPVARGEIITREDVGPLPDSAAVRARAELEAAEAS